GFAIVDVLRVLSRYHEPHKTIETILTAGSLGLVDVEFPSDSDPSCMTLLRFDKVSLAFGLQPLLDEATFSVEPNERVCLIGRNGAGKSSLFSLITGLQQPHNGQIWVQPGVRVGYLPQDLPDADDRLVYDVVADGLPEVGQYLREYHHLLQQKDQMDMERLGR